MTFTALFRSELFKLATTKMPWAFLAMLAAMALVNAFAVVAGTDMDGSKAFLATGPDQQSLMAFGGNALMIAGLFGAIAVARGYSHNTVVAMFLAVPKRPRASVAQYLAIGVGGAVLGLVGAMLTVAAIVAALPATDYELLVSFGGIARVVAASTFAGAAGAVFGAGLGSLVRNVGGAVTGIVLTLVIAPPLIIQLANGTARWMPSPLANVASGTAHDVAVLSAIAAIAAWALVPAAVGLVAVQRRDVI